MDSSSSRSFKPPPHGSSNNSSKKMHSGTSASISNSAQKSLDHELKTYERKIGRFHVEKALREIQQVSKEVAAAREKNIHLEKELLHDKRLNKKDPVQDEKLASELMSIHDEGNLYTKKLEQCKKKNEELDLSIMKLKVHIEELRSAAKMGDHMDRNHQKANARIRKMESELDRRMVQLNEKICHNNTLRSSLDHLRAERTTMDVVYTKLELNSMANKQRLQELDVAILNEESERERIHAEVEALRSRAEDDAKLFEGDLAHNLSDMTRHAQEEAVKKSYSAQKIRLGGKTVEEEQELKRRLTRGRWHLCQGKITSNVVINKYKRHREFLERMHEVSGTTSVNELVDVFILQEREHFNRIQHVNELALEIETCRATCSTLRETIARLKVRQDEGEVYKSNLSDSLKVSIQSTDEQSAQIASRTKGINLMISQLKPILESIHERIGCKKSAAATDATMGDGRSLLGAIEGRVTSILSTFIENNKRRSDGDALMLKSSSSPLDRDMMKLNGQLTGALPDQVPSHVLDVAHKEQPYRYADIRTPTLNHEDLVGSTGSAAADYSSEEEEYPLTFSELKNKVWSSSLHHHHQASDDLSDDRNSNNIRIVAGSKKVPQSWRHLSLIANASAQALQ